MKHQFDPDLGRTGGVVGIVEKGKLRIEKTGGCGKSCDVADVEVIYGLIGASLGLIADATGLVSAAR